MSSQHQSGAPMKLWISTWAISREAAAAQPKLFPSAGGVALMARVFAAAERSLRQIDQFDYLVRRWLIPIRHRLCTLTRSAPPLAGLSSGRSLPARVTMPKRG